MCIATRLPPITAAAVIMLSLTGCFGSTVPFGYDKIQRSPDYISEELLNRMATERWTRDAVVSELGKPDAANEDTRSIGYERCIVSDAKEGFVLILPLPIVGSAGDVSHCQLVKLRLDDSDRVVRWSDRVGVKEIPPEGRQVYNLGCTLDELLDDADCVDNRGLFGKDWNDQP